MVKFFCFWLWFQLSLRGLADVNIFNRLLSWTRQREINPKSTIWLWFLVIRSKDKKCVELRNGYNYKIETCVVRTICKGTTSHLITNLYKNRYLVVEVLFNIGKINRRTTFSQLEIRGTIKRRNHYRNLSYLLYKIIAKWRLLSTDVRLLYTKAKGG